MKNMRELLNLMEGVMAVPGLNEKSTSEKQARFMAAAAHDPNFAKKTGMNQEVAKEFNKADTGTDQLSNAMKHMQEDSESDMQTADTVGRDQDYSEFDASQGMATESVPAVDSCQQSNPASADVACAMEGSQYDMDFIASSIRQMYDYATSEDELRSMVAGETGYGNNPEFNQMFDSALTHFLSTDTGDSVDGDFNEAKSDKYFAPADPGADFDPQSDEDLRNTVINDIKEFINDAINGDVPTDHIYYDSASADAFEAIQASKDENLRRAYGAMRSVGEESPERFIKVAQAALRLLSGSVSEAFDLQNGYDDVDVASGIDYFPNGADSPVKSAVGPSGARQGDNPEQKKMQVAEVHKELVYGYRNFLKEAALSQKK